MRQEQVCSTKAERFTFGCEIECFLPRAAMHQHGITRGGYHAGYNLPPPFPTGWKIERDGSVVTRRSDMVAIEIVSPILSGRAGILQVRRVMEILKGMGGAVNRSCGFHVHVGVASVVPNLDDRAEWLGRLMYEVAMHEGALFAQTGTRGRENGSWSRSIKPEKRIADDLVGARSAAAKRTAVSVAANGTNRYHTLNLTNLMNPRKQTVEFRVFAGTLEWKKAYAHIQTGLALAERATERSAMNWNLLAGEFYGNAAGMRSLKRLFTLTGWTKGRRHIRQAVLEMAGWIAPLEDLQAVRAEMRRLARKYDAQV